MKGIIWIMLMAISSSVLYSKNNNCATVEADMIDDFKARLTADYDIAFNTINPRIKKNLEELLKIPESFDYPFDSLAQEINIVRSADKNLRIFSWDKMSGGTAHEIAVLAQYKTDKGGVRAKQLYTDATMKEIYELDIKGRRNYLCVGYGTYGGGNHHKAVFLYEIDCSDLKLNKESLDEKHSIIQVPRSREIDFEFNENDKTISYSQMSYEVTEDDREYVAYKKTILKLIKGKFTEYEQAAEKKDTSIIIKSEDMVFVKGGSFEMGKVPPVITQKENTRPSHNVTVGDFYIGKTEVTQVQYKEITGYDPSRSKGDNFPVRYVSWYDAIEYCNKLSEKEGLQKCYIGSGNSISCNFNAVGYRLPTEAEWEYVAGGGDVIARLIYSGSNKIEDFGWFENNSGTKVKPVGGMRPNELGIYDMSGNVWEWCWDWYGTYTKESQINPMGPNAGENRVIRGGSSKSSYECTQITYRDSRDPNTAADDIGFRVVRTAK